MVRQLIAAGLVDCFRVIMCPLVLPQTGIEPAFADWPDLKFKLLDHKVLDERIMIMNF
ncbi:MAG: hypothetical protein ABIQ90_12570 [Polaromonas sp.]